MAAADPDASSSAANAYAPLLSSTPEARGVWSRAWKLKATFLPPPGAWRSKSGERTVGMWLCVRSSQVPALGVPRDVRSGATGLAATTCAMVPLYPKELQPMRCPPPAVTFVSVMCSVARHCRPSCSVPMRYGLTFLSCTLCGVRLEWIIVMSLLQPTMPAACSRWPHFVFDAVRCRGSERPFTVTSENVAEAVSMGSPSAVPVPCISRALTSAGAMPCSRSVV
mmetsp:Transcript_3805/g.13346  ORF Transcript_3805/g.13346 Transcript_3805/m.13346 type:complete len:224 (-) Transcript_3805:3709-4380(-)